MLYHLDYKKVKKIELKPEMLEKGKFLYLAKKIHEKRKDNYWLMMMTPSGEILIPEEHYKSHGEMVIDIIYPAEPVLCMIYDHFFGKGTSRKHSSLTEKTLFSLYYGYINVDGEVFVNQDGVIDYDYPEYEKSCRYNPHALTLQTHCAEEKLREYCSMYSVTDTHFAEKEQIELSKKIAWLRNRINGDIEKCSKENGIDVFCDNFEMALEVFFTLMDTTEEEYMQALDDE